MPNDRYSSDKQRRFFHAAANRGEISQASVDRHDKASKGAHLPEYAHSGHGAHRDPPADHGGAGMGHMSSMVDPDGDSDLAGPEHPMHGPHSEGHFGGDGEDGDHLGMGSPDMHETEGRLAALKRIGHHARQAMAMSLREKMPHQPEPEHGAEHETTETDERDKGGESDDRDMAEKLRLAMERRRQAG